MNIPMTHMQHGMQYSNGMFKHMDDIRLCFMVMPIRLKQSPEYDKLFGEGYFIQLR